MKFTAPAPNRPSIALTALADRAGVASRMVGTRDPLTRLPSCHSFLLELQRSLCTPSASAGPMALIVIEPTFEGVWGLAARAMRLANIARLLVLATGRAGSATRLDERRYAVMLRDHGVDAALSIAAHQHDAVSLFFQGETNAPTLHAGVAACPTGAHWNADDLIDLAVWRCEAARDAGLPRCASGGPTMR